MKEFLIALQFLTIMPLRIKSQINEKDFGAALFYFPVVGMLIGLVLCGAAMFFDFLPSLPRSTVILLTSIVITGAVHLDGFADASDGLYGNKSKEKILEIMQDSRIGAMGAVGLVCLLLFKFSLIDGILEGGRGRALLVAPVISRWCMVFACYSSECARKESKAKFFIEYASKKEVISAGIFTVALCVFLLGLKGAFVFISVFVPVCLFSGYVKRKIGGITGDILGALNEIAEVAALFFMLVIF